MKQKKIIYSLDLLKFIMCMMIVAIHTKGLQFPAVLNTITEVFVGSAVPTFFVISSFLFFRKVHQNRVETGKMGGGNFRTLHQKTTHFVPLLVHSAFPCSYYRERELAKLYTHRRTPQTPS